MPFRLSPKSARATDVMSADVLASSEVMDSLLAVIRLKGMTIHHEASIKHLLETISNYSIMCVLP